MTLPAWPACFPEPLIAGYTVTLADANNVRSAGRLGPAMSRNRHTRQSAVIPVSYVFTPVQMGIFEAWWHWILNDGAAWFTATQAGEDLATNTCRFSTGYQAAYQSTGHWVVNGELIIDEPARG